MADTGNRFTAYQTQITEQAQQKNAILMLDESLYTYFDLRRRQVIAELRCLDRLLGLEQTIKERQR